MYVYKVVLDYRGDGSLYLSPTVGEKARVSYKAGEETYPNTGYGPLTLCKSLSGATEFVREFMSRNWWPKSVYDHSLCIMKCIYVPSDDREVWSYSSVDGRRINHKVDYMRSGWDTVLCSSVVPISIVERELKYVNCCLALKERYSDSEEW